MLLVPLPTTRMSKRLPTSSSHPTSINVSNSHLHQSSSHSSPAESVPLSLQAHISSSQLSALSATLISQGLGSQGRSTSDSEYYNVPDMGFILELELKDATYKTSSSLEARLFPVSLFPIDILRIDAADILKQSVQEMPSFLLSLLFNSIYPPSTGSSNQTSPSTYPVPRNAGSDENEMKKWMQCIVYLLLKAIRQVIESDDPEQPIPVILREFSAEFSNKAMQGSTKEKRKPDIILHGLAENLSDGKWSRVHAV